MVCMDNALMRKGIWEKYILYYVMVIWLAIEFMKCAFLFELFGLCDLKWPFRPGTREAS